MADVPPTDDVETELGREPSRPPQLVQGSWIEQKAAQARSAGVSWDDFHQALNEKWQQARDNGASDADIEKVMGFANPQPTDDRIRDHISSALNSVPPPTQADGIFSSFLSGAQHSVTGMATNAVLGRSPLPGSELSPDAGTASHLAYMSAEMLGDLPAMLAGGYATKSAAGAFALPTAIKAAVTDAYEKGHFRNASDAATRIGSIIWQTAKSAAEGKAFEAAGGAAGAYLGKFGKPAATLGSLAAGYTAQQGVTAALEARIPSTEDLTDGALLTLAGAGAMHLVERVPTVKRNIMDRWTATDVQPADTAREASNDPALYSQLVTAPEGQPAPASSISPTGEEGENLVISRPHGPFDDAVKDVLKINEPGIRYGVSAKNNPEIDLQNLEPHTAASILHEKYWKPLGLDDYPPDVAKEILTVSARDGIDAGQKIVDFLENAPKILAPKEPAGEQEAPAAEPPSVKDQFDQMVGKEAREQLTHTISRIEEATERPGFFARLAAEGGGTGGAEPPAPPSGAGVPERAPGLPARRAAGALQTEETGGAGGGGREPPQLPPGAVPNPQGGEGAYLWANPWEKAREALAEGPKEKPNTDKWYQSIYQELFNKRSPVVRLWRAVRGGDPVPADENALYHLRNEESSGSRARWVIENRLRPILDKIKPKEWEDFNTYLAAFRANAEHENGIENPMDKVAAKQVLDQSSLKYHDRFAVALKDLTEYRTDLMRYMKQKGMISADDLDRFMSERRYGIPGWRESDMVRTRRPGSSIFNPVRHVAGSQEKFVNPLEALVRDTFTRIALTDRNSTALALMRKAVPAGLATVKNAPPVPEITTLHPKGVFFEPHPVQRGEPNVTDMSEITHFGESSEDALGRWFGGQMQDNEVPVFDNGVRKLLTFSDPSVTRVLRQYDEAGMSTLMKIAGAITKPIRYMIIKANPFFGPTIATMDQFFQTLKPGGLVGENSAPANYLVGLFHSFLPTGVWDQAARNGAITHAFDQMTRDQLVQDVLRGTAPAGMFKRPWNLVNHGLEWWLTHWLSAPSVGSFARSMGRGEDILTAQARASEAVFHRSGFGGTLGRQINGVVPFFLAHLNGLEKTAKMLLGGESETGEKTAPATAWLKLASLVTVPTLMAWAAYRDKEWYKAMPDYEKDNYLPIRVGGDGPNGYTMKFRFPPIVGMLGGGIPRRIVESIVAHDPHAYEGIAGGIAESFAPPGSSTFAPSFMTPLLEDIQNRSFVSGRPIVSDTEQQELLPAARYRSYTTQTAKTIASFIDNTLLARKGTLAPLQVDHLIQGWGGNAGISALQTIERLTGSEPANTDRWSDLPIFNSIRSRYPSASSKPLDDFYNRMDDYTRVHGTLLKALREGDLPLFKETLAQHPQMAVMHKWQISNAEKAQFPVNSADYLNALQDASEHSTMDTQDAMLALANQKALKNLSGYAKMVQRNANHALKPEEQSQILDQIYMTMQSLAERGNDLLDKAGMK